MSSESRASVDGCDGDSTDAVDSAGVFTVTRSCGDEVTVPRDVVLESLYNINKHSKKYAELGTQNYRDGKKTTAKANSLKKDALYAVKSRVLQEIHGEAEHIGVHVIDGGEFYYFDYGEYSFHSPKSEMCVSRVDSPRPVELRSFSSGSEKEASDLPLKTCLQFFESELGLNANEFLSRKYLRYGHNRYFIGWKYLGDSETSSGE